MKTLSRLHWTVFVYVKWTSRLRHTYFLVPTRNIINSLHNSHRILFFYWQTLHWIRCFALLILVNLTIVTLAHDLQAMAQYSGKDNCLIKLISHALWLPDTTHNTLHGIILLVPTRNIINTSFHLSPGARLAHRASHNILQGIMF